MQTGLQQGLYIVATPIGNLSDFSMRAQDTLMQCHMILCEDTRETSKLLRHYGIKNKLVSYHKFNERKKIDAILASLHQGKSIALVSDSGTPAISDPGSRLVFSCHQQQIDIYNLPGCCSVSVAASASGLAEKGFTFIGFLPPKSIAREKVLSNYSQSTLALVCFETPHRILAALDDMIAVFGETRNVCIAREITKKFETIRMDQLGKLRSWVQNNDEQRRGEMVLVIAGADEHQDTNTEIDINKLCAIFAEEGLSARQSSTLMAKITGVAKKQCYSLYVQRTDKA